jgi:hypothetical protein
MAAHPGQTARATGDFVRTKRSTKVHVSRGDNIPECRYCADDTLEDSENEPKDPRMGKGS